MFRNTYLHNKFFYLMGGCIVAFILSFSFPVIFQAAKILLAICILLVALDYYLLRRWTTFMDCNRLVDDRLSLGNNQFINFVVSNNSGKTLQVELIDETPYQLQHRDIIADLSIEGNKTQIVEHPIRPVLRGQYDFGQTFMYISNPLLGFVQRKISIDNTTSTHVYPSIIDMKKFELQVFSQTAAIQGIRKVRKLGESNEFEHIRPYLQGDSTKAINWKATSRKFDLMVNQYQNTKSQTVYCIVDKGRSMKMPFKDLTLLDHAINSALVLSNIILKKHDKVGLISFSEKIGTILPANSRSGQLENITKQLYNQKTNFAESNFELLHYVVRRRISRRSIILMYSNFETRVDLERNLPYLKSIAKKHLLVMILFINTEIENAANMICTTKSDIYMKTMAQTTLHEKEKITYLLRGNGIQTILTKPKDLSVNVINKYLEIKNKRMV